jgi:uncharacterized protein YkwD
MRSPSLHAVVAVLVAAAACVPAGPRRAGDESAARAAADSPPRDPPRPAQADPGAAPATPSAGRDALEMEMAELVNRHRLAAGCPSLEWDSELARVARAHSASMRAEGFFDHVDREGRDPFARLRRANVVGWRIAAENIALTPRPPADVLGMWLRSPGHRANLENCALTRHGLGRVEGFWTHVFIG